jgi:bifunctional DNA-binding transcriptional regulator/antitoxin component of YhaV-PrlF toxin-antitoxin module
MKTQTFKAVVQKRGRITILAPYLDAGNIEPGDILEVRITKVDIKKED